MTKSTLCALLFVPLLSAADLMVRVTDPQNHAIPSATVSLIARDGERRTLSTDMNGSCRFTAR